MVLRPIWGASIHAPLTRSDSAVPERRIQWKCFNPRPAHAERLLRQQRLIDCFRSFNPRPAHAERPQSCLCLRFASSLQSTPRSRGATGKELEYCNAFYASIHAPLTRSDRQQESFQDTRSRFNPRPAHAERPVSGKRSAARERLQSTPRSRGATIGGSVMWRWTWASIHAPLTRSDKRYPVGKIKTYASIHAPLTRSDRGGGEMRTRYKASIHAPLTRSDLNRGALEFSNAALQSTPRSRGATVRGGYLYKPPELQSTPRSRGATVISCISFTSLCSFNPRPAHAERPWLSDG